MSKLQYRTKKAKPPFCHIESNMEHLGSGFRDKFPDQEVQRTAMDIVHSKMEKLLSELEPLGYDVTRAGFFIHFKNQ